MSDPRKHAKRAKKDLQSQLRRARYNRQDPTNGQALRPAKKQGCLSMSAVAALSLGALIAGAVLTIKGVA